MKTTTKIPFLKQLALVAALASGLAAQAQVTYTWTNLLGGSWTNAVNWTNSLVAGGSGNIADFSTLTLGAARTVTLDGSKTIGSMLFGDVGNTYGWTLSTGSSGPVNLTVSSGTPTITVNNQTTTVSAVLAGSAGMVKAGAGNLALTALNSYTGTTTVNAGNLTLSYNNGGNGTLAATTLTINPGAMVTATVGNALGYGGNWVRTVNIYGGTYTNTFSGADANWETTFNLMGGTLASGGARWAVDNNAASAFNTLATNKTSTISGSIYTRSTSGLIPFNVAAGTATPDLLVSALINNNSSGQGIVKTGTGVMSLTAANTFNGGTVVSNGVLQLSGSGGGTGTLVNSAVTVFAPGELQLNTGDGLGYTYAAARTLTLLGGTMREVGAYSETWARPTLLSNATVTAKSGAGATGTGVVGDCYNLFNSTAVVTTAPNSTNYITLNAGQNFALRGGIFSNAPSSFLIVNGVIDGWSGQNTWTLSKIGAGTMILNSNNTYTGATTINGGTLHVDGSIGSGAVTVGSGGTLDGTGIINGATTIQSGGTLAGDPDGVTGTLSISNTLTFNAGSTNVMRINKTGGTTTSDSVQVLNSVTYGGTLTVTNVTSDGHVLGAGDIFYLFNAASYSGAFASNSLPALAAGLTWDTSQLTVNGSIQVLSGSTPPTFTPPAGGYIGSVTVGISSDAGTTIYYTTDGSDPTTSGTRASGASPVSGIFIPVNSTETLKAYATNTTTHANGSPVVTANYATVPTGIWTNTLSGSWPANANWNVGAVPNGSGITADFSTVPLTAAVTVTLSGPQTIGKMLFEDQNNAYGWVLNGTGPLTVDAGATVPSIVVSNQGVNISTTIIGTNGLTISSVGGSPTPSAGVILSSLNNNFTNLTLSGVSVTNTTAAGSGSTTFDLGAKVAASTLTVNSNAMLTFTINNIFGGGGMTNTTLPTLVINGLVYSTRYNAMPNIVLNGGTLDQAATDSGGYQGYQFLGSVTVGGTAASTISSGIGKADHLLGSGTVFNVAVTGAVGPDLTVSMPLANASGDYGSSAGVLIKTGLGTMALTGTSTYTGNTIVSNGILQIVSGGAIANGPVTIGGGTLEVDGSTGTGAVTVNAGILDGTGSVGGTGGSVTINSGGTLSAGTPTGGIGTLTIGEPLVLSGTTSLRISKNSSSPASDLVQGMTTLTYGGTLTVTDVTSDGSPFAASQTFHLFNSSHYSGLFTTLNLPALPAGLFWDTSGLTTGGTIAVTANAPTPVFSPTAGGYVGTVTVTISSEAGAEIWYTTDGTDPLTSPTTMSNANPATVTIPANTSSETITAYASVPAGSSGEATSTYSTINTPTWTYAGSGNWSTTANWLNSVVGNGTSVTADFSTVNLAGSDATVTLDIAPTIGSLIFQDQGNANNWILAAGGYPLNLAVTNGSPTQPTITVNNETNFIYAVVTGTNGLVKAGAGTLVLGNFDTYTGNTIVNGGNLVLATNNTGEGTIGGTLTVNNGATATATAVNALGYTNTTVLRSLQVTTLNLLGGTFNNAATGDNGWGLQVNMMGGTLAATGTGAHLAAGQGTVINTLATNVPSVISGTINTRENNPSPTNMIPFNVASGSALPADLLVSGSINAQTAGVGILKSGPGVMMLANTNGFSGATIVSNGILQLQAGGGPVGTLANSAVTVFGPGELRFFTQDGLGSTYSATRTLALMGATMREVNTNSESLARPILMSNAVITASSGAGLDAAHLNSVPADPGDCYNLYGATAIVSTAPGTTNYINLPSAGQNFSLRGGSFSNAANAYLIVNAVLNSWSTNSAFGLTLNGPGTTVLNSNNTYIGSTVVNGGNLEVDGSISNGTVTIAGGSLLDGNGVINGSPTIQSNATLMAGTLANMGTLSISNVLTFNAGSTNAMRINKTGVTLTSDQLAGMVLVNYGGTLVVTATGATLAQGDTFYLFNAANYSGSFASYNLPALGGTLSWDTSQLNVNGSIRVISGTGTPSFSPPGGNYVGAQSVTITADAGATIFYTTDGSAPTTASTHGTSPVTGIIIPVGTTETLQAFATNSGYTPSLTASATYVTVPTAIWTNTAGGSWPVAANWHVGAVGDGSGITADFSTLTLTANTTVALAAPETIGSMWFKDQGNTYNWVLNGAGPLTVDAGAAVPSIVVSNQTVTISAPLAGTNGLVKAGAGTLVLNNNETYTGTTTVNAGNLTLSVGGLSGTLSSPTMTINPGASVTAAVTNALGYGGTFWVTNLNVNGGTFTATTSGDQGWGLNINLMGGTLTTSGAGAHYAMGGGTVVNTLATNVTSTISGTLRSRNGQPNNLIPFNVAAGSATPDLLVSAVIDNYQTGDGIVKTGPGVMVLNGANTYDGVTIVSNGTLEVDGSIAGGGVTVNGGKLDGIGTINGYVTVNNGTLSAGTASAIGTLVINSGLQLSGGTVALRLSKIGSVLTNDNVQVNGGVSYGGTLTATATGNDLAAGDKFTLFSSSYLGSFASYSLPGLGTGLGWDTSYLNMDGSIRVINSVNTTPTNITATVSGNLLTLSWPADHTGWRLLTQTNNLAQGISSNTNDWTTVIGSTGMYQTNITIDPTLPAGFYRLVYP